MKILIITVAFLFIKTEIQAQVPSFIPPRPRYDTCNNLQQFEGEWRYTNGTKTIKIFFRCHRSISNAVIMEPRISDELWGWHEYMDGNTVIESDYQYRYDSLPYDHADIPATYHPIFLRLTHCNNTDRLEGYIRDYNNYNQTKYVVGLLNSTGTIMTWYQGNTENGCGTFNSPCGMTLPGVFTLIKQ